MRHIVKSLWPIFVALTAIPSPALAQEGFSFGSYGRVTAGSDLRGSTPEPVNVVTHGTRVVETSYVELDVYYRKVVSGEIAVRTVTTLAILGDPFHYTGSFDARLAIRNLFAEAETGAGLSFWVGSRMVRGDDIYLLDFWPLDESNIVGAGASWVNEAARLHVGAHVGVNRLLDALTLQTQTVPDPELGGTMVTTLDRQRFTGALQSTVRWDGPSFLPSWKAKVYLEAQAMSAGERERTDGSIEELPSSFGWIAGAQVGAWGFASGRSHANLFARVGFGLAAYPDLAAPWGFDDARGTDGARELVVGWSANLELPRFGALLGGYARWFQSAAEAEDASNGWEWIADARPWVAIHGPLHAAVDVSYQARLPGAMSASALDAIEPSVFQIAPMILLTPTGPGSYARPQLRLVYRAAHLDDDALELYAPDDPRRDHPWVHFLGVQAEWWVNSTYL
jgi:maltoporin